MPPVLFLLPFIAALIGWFTNYLAVKMLFHPKTPRNFKLFTLHGVFPKRQTHLANKLGNLVSEELLSIKDVSKKIESLATNEETINLIGKRIESTIREKLVQNFPMLAMFLTDEMVEKVTNLFKSDLKEFLEKSAKQLCEKLEQEFNVSLIVQKKVEEFSSEKLEEILFSIMKKEFKFIEKIGAIIGFCIGCVQVALTFAI